MNIIEQIEAALAAATPGEWKPTRAHEDFNGPMFDIDPEDQAEYEARPFVSIRAPAATVANAHDLFEFNPADAHLIALLHNAAPALIECAEALCSLMDLHTLDEEGLPMSRWYLESTKESMIVRARTALAKLQEVKS